MKKKFLLSLLPLVALPTIIGSGFAIFFFQNDSVSSREQSVSVEMRDNVDLGNLRLVCLENGSYVEEEEDTLKKTQLFLDYDDAYLIDADNPSRRRNFVIEYTAPAQKKISAACKIALLCSLELKDADSRGIQGNFASSEDGNKSFYASSSSVLDIIKPKVVTLNTTDHPFTLQNDQEKARTYSCTISDELLSVNESEQTYFHLDFSFDYQYYGINMNGVYYEGKTSPSSASTEEAMACVIEANRAATMNSSLSMTFSLSLIEEGQS